MTGTASAVVAGLGAAVGASAIAAGDIAAAWGTGGGSQRATLAVCAPDEDALTLAWRAGVAALKAAGIDAASVDALYWGTARPPMPEGPSHAFLAAALGLAPTSGGLLATGSALAGMDALCAGWDAVSSGHARIAVVVASDALVPGAGTAGERETGAGAAAVVLVAYGAYGAIAGDAPALLYARVTATRPVLDRHRGDGMAATADAYDARLYREKVLVPAVSSVHEILAKSVDGATAWSLPDPDGSLAKVVARSVGVAAVCSEGVHAAIGDTGAAAPLLGAFRGLARPGTVAVVGYGAGRATGVAIEVTGEVPGAREAAVVAHGESIRDGDRIGYVELARSRGQIVPLAEPVAMGVPPGSAAFVRGAGEIFGFAGRRCDVCGTVAVPPSIHPVCPGCGSTGGNLVALARSGTVQTFVVNETMPPPFEAPLPLVVCDLDDGARVMLQGLSTDATVLAVGDRVDLELRRYALERGVPVYGFKARRSHVATGEEP
ncbi:MAG: OB-fold domain-containing protein [Actinomycetota bacterium]|nr:OB-fold domain-containing protein [Actinomycetota bacterium]